MLWLVKVKKVLKVVVAEKVVALNMETRYRAGGTTDPRLVRRFEGQVGSGLQWLQAEVPEQKQDPWFLGPEMTQADVTAACALTHSVEKRPELFPPRNLPSPGSAPRTGRGAGNLQVLAVRGRVKPPLH